jgi:Tol biopolymer transport system component
VGVRSGTLAVLASLLMAPVAGAAGPGDNLLVSRPSGNDPISPSLFAWNASGRTEFQASSQSNITADGRYVVFATQADGLAEGEDPGPQHIVRKDLQTGEALVVDAGANDTSTDPDISDDGRYVVFASFATNLAAADTAPDADVFVKDLQTGTVRLLSSTAAEPEFVTSMQPVISANGAKVAFATENALDATNDTNGKRDVYAVNADGSGSAQLVSATGTGAAANGDSDAPSITDDGTLVAYISAANDINFGSDPDTSPDLYVHNLSVVGSSLGSAQNGNSLGIGAGSVFDGEISGDGTRVVFTDTAQYLPADADSAYDVWRRTLATKTDELISVADDETNSDAAAFGATTDGTGSLVAFTSSSTNLGGSVAGFDLYVRDQGNGNTKIITDGAGGITGAALTHGSGNRVVFEADRPLSDSPAPEAIHAAPSLGGVLQLVSVPASGVPLEPGLTATFEPNFTPEDRRVSADGRYVVFTSSAAALGGPADLEACWRRDVRTGETLLVSTGMNGPVFCATVSISADGNRFAFETNAILDQGDAGSDLDVYVHDIASGANTLVSRADGPAGANSDGTVADAEISADGTHVAFVSTATNLGAAGGGYHVYERDVAAGTTTIVDRTTAGDVGDPAISSSIGIDATGRRVAFATGAHLDPVLDNDLFPDVYVRDLVAGTTTLASVQSASAGGAKGTTGSLEPALSGNGRVVAFLGTAPNLDPAAGPVPPVAFEVFVHDLDAQTTRMASVAPSGAAGDASAFNPALDDSGDVVAFEAQSPPGGSNVSPNLDPLTTGVVVRRISANTATVVQAAPAVPHENFAGRTTHPSLSADGRCVTVFARGRGLVAGISPDFVQLYEHVLDGDCSTTPQSPAGGGGPPPAGQPAAHAPALSKVSMTNRRFRIGRKRTAVTARRKRAKAGTTFRFTLSDTATVRIRLEQLKKGRRSGKRCVKPTRKLRRHKPCTRGVLKGTLTRRALTAGAHRVAFSGRIGRRKLARGRHRATLTAIGPTGLKSASTTLAFRIVG